MKLAMDADAMIKVTKAQAKEPLAQAFTLILAPAVEKECIDQGKAAGHGDAARIEENLRKGIVVANEGRHVRRAESILEGLGLSDGEADALRLYMTARADLVVTDDRKFARTLEGLAVPYATPAGLLVALESSKRASRSACLRMLERMAPLISEEEFLQASLQLGGG